MKHLLCEVPENFEKVCAYFENDESKIYANLMPKCGTMYARECLNLSGPWSGPRRIVRVSNISPEPWPVLRGDHYVCSNEDRNSVPRRGWFRNQVRIFGPSKLFWFTIVRNPYNMLVSYFTFGWPYSKNVRPYTDRKFINRDIFQSFDYFIKSYCDPDFNWIIKDNQKFLYFPIFDKEGDCRCPVVFRLEDIDFCMEQLGKNFNFVFRAPTPAKSSRADDKSRNSWKSYYSNELYDLVSKKFERECNAFGYDFDGIKPGDKRKIIDSSNIKYYAGKDELKILEYNDELIFELMEKFHG